MSERPPVSSAALRRGPRRWTRRKLYRAARKVGKQGRIASVRYVLRSRNARWNRA